MNQPKGSVPPYRVVYSERCREETRQLLARARAKGRFAEVAQAIRGIDTRLQWIPLDFGEPLQYFAPLGVKKHIGALGPLVVKYGVDEDRRLVYVAYPFNLLPRTGL